MSRPQLGFSFKIQYGVLLLCAAQVARAGSMAASGENKIKNKTHIGSQSPHTHMHPLAIVLSITCCTILPTHMITDTCTTLGTDAAGCAAGCATTRRGASSSTCWNVARRFGLVACKRVEPSLKQTENTEPGPLRKPNSPEYPVVLLQHAGVFRAEARLDKDRAGPRLRGHGGWPSPLHSTTRFLNKEMTDLRASRHPSVRPIAAAASAAIVAGIRR
jgi:hypothetical protein